MSAASGATKKNFDLEIKSGYAILTLCSEPVNTMTMSMWKELNATLEKLEKDSSVRGLIITSGLSKNLFSAGNDIKELYAPNTNEERYTTFHKESNRFLGRLFFSRLVVISAIKGACPAAGTCVAMVSDIRIVTPDTWMSLNEVSIGVPVPEVWIKVLAFHLGASRADKAVQYSQKIDAQSGKDLGFIDEIVNDAALLIPAAEIAMKTILKLSDSARATTKQLSRRALAEEWLNESRLDKEGREGFHKIISAESTVKALGATLARLGGGKSKI
ncbi:hypothetical protein PROFUN_03771 [Planoprotostelium fungivorum]|uniref:Uncharacterized protein n=1 Tax=Planoprotostelium fungivorum TaxID=1890364 RepID=A0A2P6NDS0_9EUKA|nr:hypothetical protein PROFUN_03771 [Planoprotostelium fungivorum]